MLSKMLRFVFIRILFFFSFIKGENDLFKNFFTHIDNNIVNNEFGKKDEIFLKYEETKKPIEKIKKISEIFETDGLEINLSIKPEPKEYTFLINMFFFMFGIYFVSCLFSIIDAEDEF